MNDNEKFTNISTDLEYRTLFLFLKGDLYQPGSVVIYSCRNGFVLLPLSAGKRVCRKGFWEGQLPACRKQFILYYISRKMNTSKE